MPVPGFGVMTPERIRQWLEERGHWEAADEWTKEFL